MSEHSINKLPPKPHSQSISSNSNSNRHSTQDFAAATDLDLSQLTIQNDENIENEPASSSKKKHFSGPMNLGSNVKDKIHNRHASYDGSSSKASSVTSKSSKRRNRRQKKNGKSAFPKITDWAIEDENDDLNLSDGEGSDFENYMSDNNIDNVDLDQSIHKVVDLFQTLSSSSNITTSTPARSSKKQPFGTPAGFGQVSSKSKVRENTIARLRQEKRILHNEPIPDTGQMALEKIENSATLKTIINEKAAMATHIGNYKEQHKNVYNTDLMTSIEHPDGSSAILEAAKRAKLASAPLIVIPPKPEAKFGQPDIHSILPSDGTLSYSCPSWKRLYKNEVKNELEQASVEDCAEMMGRYGHLYEDLWAPYQIVGGLESYGRSNLDDL